MQRGLVKKTLQKLEKVKKQFCIHNSWSVTHYIKSNTWRERVNKVWVMLKGRCVASHKNEKSWVTWPTGERWHHTGKERRPTYILPCHSVSVHQSIKRSTCKEKALLLSVPNKHNADCMDTIFPAVRLWKVETFSPFSESLRESRHRELLILPDRRERNETDEQKCLQDLTIKAELATPTVCSDAFQR